MSDNILNITNGDSAVNVMREAGITGEYLPWRDVLHEGPVPAGVAQQDLNKVRARFLASDDVQQQEILDWLNYRDSVFELANTYHEVLLWFEHDLYDQLQLIQILSMLATKEVGDVPVNLICVADYLGPMQPQLLAVLPRNKQAVTDGHYIIAKKVWQAFTSFDPIQIYNLLTKDLAPFEFLKTALFRLLQQYPAVENGLNRTEKQILEALLAGNKTPSEIFAANQEADETVFMGDSTFWKYMHGLASATLPLLKLESGERFRLPHEFDKADEFNQQQILITDAGRTVVAGKADYLDLYDIDRWYGGVHLHADNIWRWNNEARSLCR